MKTLYNIIAQQLSTYKKMPIDWKTIIEIYWLTNMACKIVYVDNHFHIGNDKQIEYLVHLYNTVITSKVVDLENFIAYKDHYRKSTQTSGSFVNSTEFDMITINTIRRVLKIYNAQSEKKIKIVTVPKISINGMTI